jgi:predicted alpha/beta-fold hydrolase
VGISLGGNVLLKWLGEQGNLAVDEVCAAAAISTPFDLAAAAEKMSAGAGKLYSRFFLHTLKQKALRKAEEYPDLIDGAAVRQARTWQEYDDAVTAPLHGFQSAEDYWRRSSSVYFLDRIRRPTLLISARDDPFIPESSLPEEQVARSPWLVGLFTPNGGHAGFIAGRWPWQPLYWAERRAVEFLSAFVPALPPSQVARSHNP